MIDSQALLTRIRGDLAKAEGKLAAAARHYGDARDMLLRINPVDAAVAGIDAATALMDLGELAEAVRTAQEMARLTEPLHKISPVVAGVVIRLLVTIARGDKISRRNLEQYRREITQAASRLG